MQANGALTRSVLHQLSCCRQDASLLCQEVIGTYDTMSVPGSAVATHRVVCPIHAFHWVHRFHFAWWVGSYTARLTQPFNLDQPPIVRPWLALGRGGGAMPCVAVQRMTGRFMTNFMQILVKNRTFLRYTAIYNSLWSETSSR